MTDEYFKCRICGKKHQLFTWLKDGGLPYLINSGNPEKEGLLKDMGGYYLLDNQNYFIKGNLYINFEDNNERPLNFEVWVEIENEEFRKRIIEFEEKEEVEIKGKLFSQIPFYKESKGLQVKLILSQRENQSKIIVIESSEIMNDQINNISKQKLVVLNEQFYHSFLSKDIDS